MDYNIYCDESCHLENDRSSTMVLGAVTCQRDQLSRISKELRQIKIEHALLSQGDLRQDRDRQFEVKWTKVSPARLGFYREWVRYFFAESALTFRAVVIDKELVDHTSWNQFHKANQTHDEWYYKMFFRLIEPVIDPQSFYNIYLDIKDTRSENKRKQLESVLRSAKRDRVNSIIGRVQQIRSHESEIMQMTDLLIGAVCFHHRKKKECDSFGLKSTAKMELVRLIQNRSRQSLDRTSWLKEQKFNLLIWHPREVKS